MGEAMNPWTDSLRKHPLVVLWAAATAGVLCDRFLPLGGGWFVLALSSWAVWFLLQSRSERWSEVALLVCVAASMAFYHHASWRLHPRDALGLVAWRTDGALPIAVRGLVLTSPESTPLETSRAVSTLPQGVRTRFVIRAEQVRDGRRWRSASGQLRVQVQGHLLDVAAGSPVQVFGRLVASAPRANPGETDLRVRDRATGVLASLEVPYPDCVQKTGDIRWSLRAAMGWCRERGLAQLDRDVGAYFGRFAGALLLGARHRLEQERIKPFFHTGTIHVLAISGLHVGLLAGLFLVVVPRSPWPRDRMLGVLMLAIVFYGLVTGMRAPVLRAGMLVQIVCLGLLCHRAIRPANALAAAALAVMCWSPVDVFQVGTQLSFLAVASLIWLSCRAPSPDPTPLDALIARSRPWWQRARRTLMTSTARLFVAGFVVWVVTLPLVTCRFHLFSPVAIVLNVALAIPLAISVISGFGVLILCPVPWASRFAGHCCAGSLSWLEWFVSSAEQLPLAYRWVAGPDPWWCLVFYVGLAGWVFVPRLQAGGWRVLAALLVVWMSLPVAMSRWGIETHEERSRITFLSVGHGTCVVMELPQDRVIMYDAGRMGLPQRGTRLVSEFLWSRGISHLDAIVISHADADHYNVVPDIVSRFSVGRVFVSAPMRSRPDAGTELLLQQVADHDVPLSVLRADEVIRLLPQTVLRVLHPHQPASGSDNANSIVLEITHQGRRILLPGDLEGQGMHDVLWEERQDADVIMAPHHGSPHSLPERFADWCLPEWVVISSGDARADRLVQMRSYAGAGRTVFHTAEHGAITVELGRQAIGVTAFWPQGSQGARAAVTSPFAVSVQRHAVGERGG